MTRKALPLLILAAAGLVVGCSKSDDVPPVKVGSVVGPNNTPPEALAAQHGPKPEENAQRAAAQSGK